MSTDPPSQGHSETSVESSRSLSRKRLLSQERWTYEALQKGGRSDWQLWDMVKNTLIFDQKSSLRRARVGLMWRNRTLGATPWHPVEDSGKTNKDPFSNKRTVIWQIKDQYKEMPYDEWFNDYRRLAKGNVDEFDA